MLDLIIKDPYYYPIFYHFGSCSVDKKIFMLCVCNEKTDSEKINDFWGVISLNVYAYIF